MNSTRKLVFRSPQDTDFIVDADEEFVVLEMDSPQAAKGRWVIHQENTRSRFFNGMYRGSRMDNIGSTLVFNSDMADVGAEFVVLLHSKGLTVVCLAVSPDKCPLPRYHDYLEGYIALLGFPGPDASDAQSVRGRSADEGRETTEEEEGFSALTDAVRINNHTSLLKHELQKHARGRGGEKGVHPTKTLSAWRSNPDWYEVRSDDESADEETIPIAGHQIRPVRTVPREGRGSNLFVSSSVAVLDLLARQTPPGPYGETASTLLSITKQDLQSIDTIEDVSFRVSWEHLKSTEHPPHSQAFADVLIRLHDRLQEPEKRRPDLEGKEPYYLPNPAYLFQWYVTACLLIALGVDPSDVGPVIHELQQKEEVRIGDYSIWADNDNHEIPGWRDRTHSPSNYQPDIVVIDQSEDEVLLADAKFRLHNDREKLLTHGSIKDIQAYMQEYGLDKGLILVPSKEDRPPLEDIDDGNGFRIRGVAVPPGAPPADMATEDPGPKARGDFTNGEPDVDLSDSVRDMWNAKIRHNMGTNDE
jgi:hypothetical protein